MYKQAIVAGALALGAGVALPTAASAAPAQIVIHVVEHQTTFAQQGNAFSFESRLTQNGKLVGHDAVTCYLHGQCTGRFTLSGEGDLFGSVPESQTNSRTFLVPIIGGTQSFTNAHGNVTIAGVNDSTSNLTFRFHT
jgi:hypothetical protein